MASDTPRHARAPTARVATMPERGTAASGGQQPASALRSSAFGPLWGYLMSVVGQPTRPIPRQDLYREAPRFDGRIFPRERHGFLDRRDVEDEDPCERVLWRILCDLKRTRK